jgi:hypothetical protein
MKKSECRRKCVYRQSTINFHSWHMTRDTLETAVREGIPFVINMADGKSYEVREVLKIAVGRTRVVVLDERDLPRILPMLTMTGISYLSKENGAK